MPVFLNAFIKVLIFVLLLVIVWSLRLPLVIDLPLYLAMFWLFIFRSMTEISLCSFSLFTAIGVMQLFLVLFVPEGAVFYREHERWALPEGKYVSNVEATISVPHGDLFAIDPALPKGMAEPRVIHFKTDDLGYRNNVNYHRQAKVLLGDSFVVGNGMDQDDTIVSQLKTQFNLDTYSLAFVDSPGGYEQRALEFLQMSIDRNPELRFSMFIYEGNDFVSQQESKVSMSSIGGWWQRAEISYSLVRSRLLSQVLPRLNYSTLFYNLISRSLTSRWLLDQTNGKVSIYPIGREQLGFFDPQTAFAAAPDLDLQLSGISEVWNRVQCVFFVPTKARVYKQFLPTEVSSNFTEPAAGLIALRKSLVGQKARIVDLTPDLQSAAELYLAKGQYVFWKDDTHWNRLGVSSVLQSVINCMSNQN